jgi:hypothetical protein
MRLARAGGIGIEDETSPEVDALHLKPDQVWSRVIGQ